MEGREWEREGGQTHRWKTGAREVLLKGRLGTVNLLIRYVMGCFVKKKSTVLVWEQVSTRRSTVLMVPLQLGFPAGALNWKRAQ